MNELSIHKYYRVLPLIQNIPYDTLMAEMLIEKTCGGKVLVDDTINPTVALFVHFNGMSLLCGNEQNDGFNTQLVKMLFSKPGLVPRQIRMMVYPEAWQRKLQILLGESLIHHSEIGMDKGATLERSAQDQVIEWMRVKFAFNPEKFAGLNWRKEIPNGLNIQRIDDSIVSKIHGTVVPQNYWDSSANFLKRGVGFCLMDGATLIGVSFSAFIASGRIDIGIETTAEFRGQGLGMFASAAMVEYCLENGFEPVWGCRNDNIASYRLAQKLGFEEKFRHPMYWAVNIV